MSRITVCLAVLSLMFIGAGTASAQSADGTGVITFESGTVAVPTAPDTVINTAVPPAADPAPTGDQSGGVQDSPEPATLTLLGLGGLGAWWNVRRRKAATLSASNA
jgi:hypothetical protein